jgi:hypothetical protein
MAENMDTQLKQMSEDLKEIIEHLNETNRTQDTNDPVSYSTNNFCRYTFQDLCRNFLLSVPQRYYQINYHSLVFPLG